MRQKQTVPSKPLCLAFFRSIYPQAGLRRDYGFIVAAVSTLPSRPAILSQLFQTLTAQLQSCLQNNCSFKSQYEVFAF